MVTGKYLSIDVTGDNVFTKAYNTQSLYT